MKNLKQLGILASTAVLSLALLTSCSSGEDNDSTSSESSGTTSGQTESNTSTPSADLNVDNDMSLESEDEQTEEEGDIPSPEDVENSDPAATPPPEDGMNQVIKPTDPDHAVESSPTPAPEPAPEAPAPAPEAEAPPEAPAEGGTDLNAFYRTLMSKYEFAMLEQAPAEVLSNFYPGLESVSTKQASVYMAMMTAVATEIALVEVANSADVATVEAIFNARIKTQAEGGAFYPEATEAWNSQSAVVSSGNYVMMIVHPDYQSIINDFQSGV